MKLCAIHQPNFFPWLGYFDKLAKADVFVFLDRVSYPKSGSSMSSWCNRVKINVGGTATWTSCPVIREHGIQIIDTVRIDDRRPWRNDLRLVLEASYRGAVNFQSAFAVVDALLSFETDSLADFNIHAIRTLMPLLGCEAKCVRQSALPPADQTATARLVALTRLVGADGYLCGGGSAGYLEEAAFADAGLTLRYQDTGVAPYGDPAQFIPGLSVIDWLMHHRPEDTFGRLS